MKKLIILIAGLGNDEEHHWERALGMVTAALSATEGGGSIIAPPLDMLNTSVAELAAQVAKVVENAIKSETFDVVCIFGHSTGGVVGRIVSRELSGRCKLRCVWAGAPFGGTPAALFIPGRTARDIRPGVPIVDPRPIDGVAERVLFGKFDIIVPRASATLIDAPAEEVWCDHGGLAWTTRSLRVVWTFFDEPWPPSHGM